MVARFVGGHGCVCASNQKGNYDEGDGDSCGGRDRNSDNEGCDCVVVIAALQLAVALHS